MGKRRAKAVEDLSSEMGYSTIIELLPLLEGCIVDLDAKILISSSQFSSPYRFYDGQLQAKVKDCERIQLPTGDWAMFDGKRGKSGVRSLKLDMRSQVRLLKNALAVMKQESPNLIRLYQKLNWLVPKPTNPDLLKLRHYIETQVEAGALWEDSFQ